MILFQSAPPLSNVTGGSDPRSEPDVLARGKRRPRNVHRGDRIFFGSLRAISFALIALIVGMFCLLLVESIPTFQKFGWQFLTQTVWDPVQLEFGALPVIFGTLVSSAIGLVIAAPLSIGIALFINEVAPKSVAAVVMFLVEMLAAIPSVVYGLWGILVLAPFCRDYLGPLLQNSLGFLPMFQGTPFGLGMLTAGIILAIMITPTIASICREVFRTIPIYQREAALGLGATRWEMMQLAILKASRGGIIGAMTLGLGRAIGETMAVTMLIGNRAQISASFFDPAQTMASVIANEYAEASSDGHMSALVAIGVVLFAVTLIINLIAQRIVNKMAKSQAG